jgi:3-deoxy-alpha-D-manno-octulosonate 8-oxidase
MSYGLSYLLGVHHGIGNCLVFQQLEEFYPEGVQTFNKMRQKHKVVLPTGICSELTDSDFDIMINVALSLEPLWQNALGDEWRKQITPEKLKSIYQKI